MPTYCHADPKCEESASDECKSCEQAVCLKHEVRRDGLVFCSTACAE
jgi:hypothetical protein